MMRFAVLALLSAQALAAPMASDRSRYDACLALVATNPSRAIETAQAWRIEGGGVAARHCLALAQFERKDYAAALESYESAARASETAGDGQAVALWGQAGAAAMRAGRAEAAARYFSTAIAGAGGITLSPRAEAQLRVERAEALVELKRNAEAATDLDTATKLFPEVSFGWLLKATLARRMGDFPTAEAAILKAAERQHDSADVQYEAGNIAAAQGNDRLAREAWLAAARAEPDSLAGKAANAALQGD